MAESDGVAYDSDFEEASEGEDTHTKVPPSKQEPLRATSQHSMTASPVTPSPVHSTSGLLGETGGAGRRPVRAKVSVAGRPDQAPDHHRSDSIPRPGTGDSGGRHLAAAQRDSKPIWLQGGSASDGSRRNVAGDTLGTNHIPRAASRDLALPRSQTSSNTRNQGIDVDVFGVDASRAGTADGGDARKVKRLQQEVQRLSARLKEAELVSPQEDGLPTFTLEDIELGYQIGQGGFSSVHHAVWHCTPVSVKKIFDPVITDELRGEFENEVRMLRRLRHPNIITLMAVCRVPPALSILTEFMDGGSLFELLHGAPKSKSPNTPECELATLLPIMHQSAVALAHMHAMCIVHRDVKSHNVLLTAGKQPLVKLCDFGLARMKSELCTGSMQWAGTAAYMAPELFAKKRYTETVDVFAFGVMLWEVLSMEIPHANMDPADIARRVQHKDVAGLAIAHGWPKALKALIRACLAVNAESRPVMDAIVADVRAAIACTETPD